MNQKSLDPCGRISRRGFLCQAGGGFFGAAMGGLWAEAGEIRDASLGPHFPPQADSVIFLFMCGGVTVRVRTGQGTRPSSTSNAWRKVGTTSRLLE